MNCNYKVNIKDIQNKYKFNIFAMGGYNDSDLRKMIESVFYALPRTTASGTSVTLNDTAFSYMKNKLNATDTSQESTTGKNIFNKETTPIEKSANVVNSVLATGIKMQYTGTTSYTGSYDYGIFVLKDLTNYVGKTLRIKANFVANSNNTGLVIVGLCNEDGSNRSNKGNISTSGDTYSLVIPSLSGSQTYLYIGLYANAGGERTQNCYVDYTNFIITIDNADMSYEPYTNGASPNPDYPQVIHTITGDNELIVSGKNLLNRATCEENKILTWATGILWNDTGSLTSDYIEAKANETIKTNYYAYIFCFDSNKTYLGNINQQGELVTNAGTYWKSRTIPNNSNIAYIRLVYRPTGNEGINLLTANIMTNKGDTLANYEPYQSNSVLLTLGDKEICKIENYEDKIFKAIKGNEVYDSLASEEKATLDYGKWYLRKAIGKVVLNGSESWQQYNDYVYISSGSIPAGVSNSTTINGYCNYTDTSVNTNIRYNSSAHTGLEIRNLTTYWGLSDYLVATWETWLSTHNTIVYYPLATPTNELFNDTIQDQLEDIYNNMLSYEGQTNVSQVNEDLPFNINSTALKDLNNL